MSYRTFELKTNSVVVDDAMGVKDFFFVENFLGAYQVSVASGSDDYEGHRKNPHQTSHMHE